jgi:magnesium transporter
MVRKQVERAIGIPGAVMRRRRVRITPGASPGTLTASAEAHPTLVELLAYGPDRLVEETVGTSLERALELGEAHPVVWINVAGLADVDLLARIGERFDLHPLALEDVVNAHQRPKTEGFESHYFVVTRIPHGPVASATEQVALFLGPGFVLTFQERPGDCFDSVRGRIREGRKRLRQGGADYLAYALVDAIIDAYFPAVEAIGDRLEEIEEIIARADTSLARATVSELHLLKRELFGFRRVFFSLRDAISGLERDESHLFEDATRLYLRDCLDHVVHLFELTEAYRDTAANLMDLHHAMMSNRMNEVMKVLTVIATIFIPLSFVAGLYGMNFDPGVSSWNMPELGWRYGYPFALAIMFLVAVGMLLNFRRMGWLEREDAPPKPDPPGDQVTGASSPSERPDGRGSRDPSPPSA